MIGYIKSFKCPIESRTFQEYAYNVIQLKEPHEAGEIINNHWLICNNGLVNDTGKYEKGYYVKVANLNLVDIFATDINYDDRKDLEKYNTEIISGIKVNVYRTQMPFSRNEMITEHNEKLITENLKLKQTLKWIKGQYDMDFTEDEIQELEPRDKCIYEEVEKVINRFERKDD
jgi:hypothetical protein